MIFHMNAQYRADAFIGNHTLAYDGRLLLFAFLLTILAFEKLLSVGFFNPPLISLMDERKVKVMLLLIRKDLLSRQRPVLKAWLT